VVIGSAWYGQESKEGLEEAAWKDLAAWIIACIVRSQVDIEKVGIVSSRSGTTIDASQSSLEITTATTMPQPLKT